MGSLMGCKGVILVVLVTQLGFGRIVLSGRFLLFVIGLFSGGRSILLLALIRIKNKVVSIIGNGLIYRDWSNHLTDFEVG